MASRSRLILAVAIFWFAAKVQALEVVNQRSFSITVFAPPICQPCQCPRTSPSNCFCTAQCKYTPGVDVKAGGTESLPVQADYFPLAFLTVEVEQVAYNVKAADLQSITPVSTVVVTRTACGQGKEVGIVAVVFKNPKSAKQGKGDRLCLVRGERYGS